MLIRNAKDTAGKPIEVWLRGDKIAAIGQGLVVPEGEDVLDANLFFTLDQARDLTQKWIEDYNNERPHEYLEFKTPVEYDAA